jgi:transcriptional regulator with XRE-family HTH domain
MADYNPLEFGQKLREHRLKLGWSASTLSELYAEFVGRENAPPDPSFVYHLERGTTLLGQERLAILASLVGMPLALAGIVESDYSMPLDLLAYTQALATYCDKWRQASLKPEAEAIESRTNQLERAVGHSSGAEKRARLELFGFYQLLLATALGEQPSAIASALLLSTIELAKEEKFSALLAYAFLLRAGRAIDQFELTGNRHVLEKAQTDLHAALEERRRLPALYLGLLHVKEGLFNAYTARDQQEFTAARRGIAMGSEYIYLADSEQRITEQLDGEHCMLTRARAYLFAPMGDAKLGLAQLQELELEHPEARSKRRLVQRDQLFALAHLSTGDYPMAAAHLEAAVENASEDWIDPLVQIHTRLKDTAFGNDPEVGRIAVKIHQMRYPEFFK